MDKLFKLVDAMINPEGENKHLLSKRTKKIMGFYDSDGIIKFNNYEANNEAEQPAKRSLQCLQRKNVCRKGRADEDRKKNETSRKQRRKKTASARTK